MTAESSIDAQLARAVGERKVSAEMRLVLASALSHLTGGPAGSLGRFVTQDVDIKKAAWLASCHRLGPVFATQLLRMSAELPGEADRSDLAARLQEVAIRNLLLTREMIVSMQSLEAQGVPVVAFKGSVLAHQLYGQIGLREFQDVDLMVHPADAAKAVRILRDLGYRPQFDLTPYQFLRYQKMRPELGLYHPEKNVLVEVHWQLLPGGYTFSPPAEEGWDRLQPVGLGGLQLKTLSWADQFLFACAHHSKHNWPRLGWILDLALLVGRLTAQDWDIIRQHIGGFGTRRMVLVGLRLVEKIFGFKVPAINGFGDGRFPNMDGVVEGILARLLLDEDHAGETPGDDRVFRSVTESWRDVAWYWYDTVLLPTPIEWEIIRLPSALYFLYFPVRAFRLGFKHTIGRLLARPRSSICRITGTFNS